MKDLIPKNNPDNLEDALKIFEKISYKSYGFGMVFLDYHYQRKCWSVVFRNPVNFKNPGIEADTPLEAVHQMLDFLRSL